MGIALITLKIMPSSPEADLEEIKNKAKSIIEENKATKTRFEEEPIAFGLKAVKAFFDLDENHELEPIEESLKQIENISSVQVIDMRRAFG
ncbi:MAG: elongation factor 1-beta [Nanoarchaeota archaeon]|nr:elongation factor 1-beta [Nanoarchaeota archaeon]MBU1028198.1 elongation factor 1-beta [Nanoarchaeota archaeon]